MKYAMCNMPCLLTGQWALQFALHVGKGHHSVKATGHNDGRPTCVVTLQWERSPHHQSRCNITVTQIGVITLQSGKGHHITKCKSQVSGALLAGRGIVAAYPKAAKLSHLMSHARHYLLHDTLLIRYAGLHDCHLRCL